MQRLIQGDALTELRKLPAASVHICVTSPPYFGLRDYGVDGQIGLEEAPEASPANGMSAKEVRRYGTLWLNLGGCYSQGGNGALGGFIWTFSIAQGRTKHVPNGL